jgi:arsenate reductase
MEKIKVLFVCVHNAARSQMAEALLRHLAPDQFEVDSAGLDPTTLNPLAVAAMDEIGIDISHKQTKDVFDVYVSGELYNYVIAVCDLERAQKCPIFPGNAERIDWSFEDPAGFEGTWEDRLEATRRVRDGIKAKIEQWVAELTDKAAASQQTRQHCTKRKLQ